MQIKFLGHSSFLIVDENGTRIITDPYHTGPEFMLADIDESADIVMVSHQHPDHNNVGAIKGNPSVVDSPGAFKGIEFNTVDSYHDGVSGKERGPNLIVVFEVDGIRLCHLGDLGHQLDGQQISEIGRVDVLFVPVGGGFTIDAKGADEVCTSVGARVIIPMHYKTAGLPFLADVSEFLRGKDNVVESDSSAVELVSSDLPEQTSIVVLKAALSTA